MKKIKSFKLFESVDSVELVDSVCSLFEDIKSIEYILEERGIFPEYRLRVGLENKYIPDGDIRTILFNNCEQITGILNNPEYSLKKFIVHIPMDKSMSCISGLTDGAVRKGSVKMLSFFDVEVENYFTLLKEHLDYVEIKFINKKSTNTYLPWTSRAKYWEISISKDFFKKLS